MPAIGEYDFEDKTANQQKLVSFTEEISDSTRDLWLSACYLRTGFLVGGKVQVFSLWNWYLSFPVISLKKKKSREK